MRNLSEEEVFDSCIERARKMCHKYMTDKEDTTLREQEFQLALLLFEKERE